MGKRKHIKAGAGDMIKAPAGLADQIESNSFAQERAKPRGILKKTKQDGEVSLCKDFDHDVDWFSLFPTC